MITTERICVDCGAVHELWHFQHIYVPRTPEEKGWLCRQCPKCFSVGGIGREGELIEERMKEKKEEMAEIKEEIHDFQTLIRHINRNSIAIGDGNDKP